MTEPAPARVGALEAVQVDLALAGTPTCPDPASLHHNATRRARAWTGPEERRDRAGRRPQRRSRRAGARLPGRPPREPAHTVAILVRAPEPGFERVVAAAGPILATFELDEE